MNEIVSAHGYSQNQIIVWKYPTMAKLATLTGERDMPVTVCREGGWGGWWTQAADVARCVWPPGGGKGECAAEQPGDCQRVTGQ